jgi:hypothetical protein
VENKSKGFRQITTRSSDNSKVSTAKKAYSAPSLVEYGSIAKLTQGVATNGNDMGAGKLNPCL